MVSETVLGAPIFSSLSEDDALALAESMKRVELPRGRVLFTEGEPGDRLYVIESGLIKIGRQARDGRESLLTLLGPGEMFGELSLFDPGPRTGTATAAGSAVCFELRHEEIRSRVGSHPAVAMQLLGVLARRLRRTNESMTDLVFTDVPGRVAKAVLDLARRFGTRVGDHVEVVHGLTQEELAQLVGSSRETVNKALVDFESRGWIARKTKAITVLSPERLARRAI